MSGLVLYKTWPKYCDVIAAVWPRPTTTIRTDLNMYMAKDTCSVKDGRTRCKRPERSVILDRTDRKPTVALLCPITLTQLHDRKSIPGPVGMTGPRIVAVLRVYDRSHVTTK